MANTLIPNFHWIPAVTERFGIRPVDGSLNDFYRFIEDSIWAMWLILLSTALGYMSTYIYDQARKSDA